MDNLQRLSIKCACERHVNDPANRIDAYDCDDVTRLRSEGSVRSVLGNAITGAPVIRAGLGLALAGTFGIRVAMQVVGV